MYIKEIWEENMEKLDKNNVPDQTTQSEYDWRTTHIGIDSTLARCLPDILW